MQHWVNNSINVKTLPSFENGNSFLKVEKTLILNTKAKTQIYELSDSNIYKGMDLSTHF